MSPIIDGTKNLVTNYPKEIENFKPCPFCGGHDVTPNQTLDSVKSRPRLYWMNCSTCDATGPDKDTLNEAILNWESRKLDEKS